MEEQLSKGRMAAFVAHNLYVVDGDVAMPSFQYCRENAPSYRWSEEAGVWVRVSGEEEAE